MTQQISLDLTAQPSGDVSEKGVGALGEAHKVVVTKSHVVDFILDLVGYTSERNLGRLRLLEPSCGRGTFLVAAVTRLAIAAARAGCAPTALRRSVLAFVDRDQAEGVRSALIAVLRQHGFDQTVAGHLVEGWLREEDFLRAHIDGHFHVVIGSPPHVRVEELPASLQSEYRRRYGALYDRADLYAAFIERGLSLLSDDGLLSFICADGWVRNKSGAPLRELISSRYRLWYYVNLHEASPFETDVITQPSIFVLGRGRTGHVSVASLQTTSPEECAGVAAALTGWKEAPSGVSVVPHDTWFKGGEPWVLSSPSHLEVLRALEDRFVSIEDTTRVGIGIATGNDRVYIVSGDVDIEEDRLLPLVMRKDLESGRVKDAGRYVINTFRDDGKLVDLHDYPRLGAYLEAHATDVKRRSVAQRNPRSWFRTIDRADPRLARAHKLLIPDIASANQIVLEDGRYYPHHNLYFITSEHWDLELLGGLLSSRVALFFVWSYAAKMRGGYIRFQAQYLRRIRLPVRERIHAELAASIKSAFRKRDFARLDRAALEAYGLRELPPFDFVDTRK